MDPDRPLHRGIRSGAAAKRRRTAFARNATEEQGVPVEKIPIVHSGGQSRPLFTPRLWDPESSEEEAQAGVSTGAAITLPRARPLSLITSEVVRLAPKSAWLRESIERRGFEGLAERRVVAESQPEAPPWRKPVVATSQVREVPLPKPIGDRGFTCCGIEC